MAREKATGAGAVCMRGYLLTVCLSVWMDSAHGIGVQLIPQYPVVSQSVTLSVTGVNGTIREFTWYKGSVAAAPNQIFNVTPSLNSATNGPQYFPRAKWFLNGSLQISGLVPTDRGNYIVQIQTGSVTQGTVLLPVYEPVTSTVISTNDKEPQENQKVTLTCSANNAEKIIWSKNGVSLPPGLILSADNRTLTFSNVSRSDTGQYRCEASNVISKIISDPYTLTVNYGPHNLKITSLNAGKPLSLECSAESIPSPTYEWKLNGTISKIQNKTLRIEQNKISAGHYTCIVTNSATKISREISAIVIVNENELRSVNWKTLTAAIIFGLILGAAPTIFITFLLYRKYVLPLKGQSGDRREDPCQIYDIISSTVVTDPAQEGDSYMGLEHPSENTYSELK